MPRSVALGLGLALMFAYAGWQWLEPHGPHEFAYAPFAVEPMPYAAMRGFTYEQLWGHVRRICLLGPGIALFTWGLVARWRLPAPTNLARLARWACYASLLLTACLMLVVLRGRAVTDDELAYAMQATFFGEGRLTGPDLGINPNDYFNVWTPQGYTIKYLPGEPLVQVIGVKLGIPALMHLPVLGLTFWAWYRTLRRNSGERVAALGTAALACSPMLAFTTAIGLSHATCLLCVVLFGLGLEKVRDGEVISGAALSGAAFTFGLLTRPQSMVPIAAIVGVALVIELWRRRSYAGLAVLAGTGGGGASALLAYNTMLTGSPLKLPWSQTCDAEQFGFGRVWAISTYEHTVLRAVENLGVVALRLNSWWLGLPVSLAILVAYFFVARRTGRAAVWLLSGLAVVAFEFCYYSPGASDTGAIYHYELLLPGALMAGIVVESLLRYSWAPLALASSLLLGTGTWFVEQGLRFQRMVSLIHRDSDAALARLSAPALLIHERRESETIARGWVFSSFPRRYRGSADPVVTLPRITADIVERARRAYPDRQCWYFRHLSGKSTPELLKCEEATPLMARSVIDLDEDLRRAYWERPTAYLRGDYQPFQAISARRARDPQGRRLMPCCQVRNLAELGVQLPSGTGSDCVETGDP